MRLGGKAGLQAGSGDARAIVGAIDVFVGDHYFGFGGDGLHRLGHSASRYVSASIHEHINYS